MYLLCLFMFSIFVTTCQLEVYLNYLNNQFPNYPYYRSKHTVHLISKIDGDEIESTDHIKKSTVNNLTIEPDWASQNLEKISNFPSIDYLHLYKLNLEEIPILEKLPMLRRINLSRNDIIRVKQKSFSELNLNKISLSRNSIKSIETRSFPGDVYDLDLSCNELKELDLMWFVNPVMISTLLISGNRIEYLPAYVTMKLNKLTILDLSDNNLQYIEPNTFSNNFYLNEIHFAHNNITEMYRRTFTNFIHKVELLDLRFNNLNYLPDDLVKHPRIKSIKIAGNPWKCSCLHHMYRIADKDVIVDWRGPEDGPHDPSCVVDVISPDKCLHCQSDEVSLSFFRSFESNVKPRCKE